MTIFAFLSAIELGLIFSFVALGVYLSFRVLNFPDLTVDGSFPLGAAVAALAILSGVNPFLALFLAFFAGAFAGFCTAFLNVKFNILHLLASILIMTALYSVNIRIMGRPNLPLLNVPTIYSYFEWLPLSGVVIKIITLTILVVLTKLFIDRFLLSEIGLGLRATGSNPKMAKANGVSTGKMIYLGIALSNGLVAFAGGLFAQTNGFADVSSGTGIIVIGLASVILGEVIISNRFIFIATLGAIVGAILYRVAIGFALNADSIGLKPTDLNLLTALIVIFALILPKIKTAFPRKQERLKKTHD